MPRKMWKRLLPLIEKYFEEHETGTTKEVMAYLKRKTRRVPLPRELGHVFEKLSLRKFEVRPDKSVVWRRCNE